MVVPNFLFDIILFGALLLAAFLDSSYQSLTGGAATLAVVGFSLYIASQEWAGTLMRRRMWSQESVAEAVALSSLGFIYFWWRNQSDFSLLILSIGLMMASLVVTIAIIAAFGAAIKDRDARPVLGLTLTVIGVLILGVLGGVLTLFLGGLSPLPAKALVIGIGLAIWKIRQLVRPPKANPLSVPAAPSVPAPRTGRVQQDWDMSHAEPGGARWILIPRGGTLLDRFVPVLVLGAILFVVSRQTSPSKLWTPTASAEPTSSQRN